jgi:hypothetical protein
MLGSKATQAIEDMVAVSTLLYPWLQHMAAEIV